MIQPNELRIGNLYIRTEDIIDVVKELTEQYIQGEEFVIPYDSATPIPLTEEWILKFGFIKDKYHECYVLFQDEDMELDYDLDPNLVTMVCGDHAQSSRDMNIKYIHQLQNLYYALTGQELTINENQKI